MWNSGTWNPQILKFPRLKTAVVKEGHGKPRLRFCRSLYAHLKYPKGSRGRKTTEILKSTQLSKDTCVPSPLKLCPWAIDWRRDSRFKYARKRSHGNHQPIPKRFTITWSLLWREAPFFSFWPFTPRWRRPWVRWSFGNRVSLEFLGRDGNINATGGNKKRKGGRLLFSSFGWKRVSVCERTPAR